MRLKGSRIGKTRNNHKEEYQKEDVELDALEGDDAENNHGSHSRKEQEQQSSTSDTWFRSLKFKLLVITCVATTCVIWSEPLWALTRQAKGEGASSSMGKTSRSSSNGMVSPYEDDPNRFRCFRLPGMRFECAFPELPLDHPARTDEFHPVPSIFIGIGPAKTGTSAVVKWLAEHPDVVLGNSAKMRANEDHVNPSMELAFFLYDKFALNGLPMYLKAFEEAHPAGRPMWVGEKTPLYADHPTVPYQIRGMMGTHVKLIFTIRDPVESLVSLYFQRERDLGDNDRRHFPSFVKWAREKIENYVAYQQCSEKILNKMFVPMVQHPNKLPDMDDWLDMVDWQTAQMVDDHLYENCWMEHLHGKSAFNQQGRDHLTHFLYPTMIKRWRLVFGDHVKCIWTEDLASQDKRIVVLKDVLHWLELDESRMPEATLRLQSNSGVYRDRELRQLTRYTTNGLSKEERRKAEIERLMESLIGEKMDEAELKQVFDELDIVFGQLDRSALDGMCGSK